MLRWSRRSMLLGRHHHLPRQSHCRSYHLLPCQRRQSRYYYCCSVARPSPQLRNRQRRHRRHQSRGRCRHPDHRDCSRCRPHRRTRRRRRRQNHRHRRRRRPRRLRPSCEGQRGRLERLDCRQNPTRPRHRFQESRTHRCRGHHPQRSEARPTPTTSRKERRLNATPLDGAVHSTRSSSRPVSFWSGDFRTCASARSSLRKPGPSGRGHRMFGASSSSVRKPHIAQVDIYSDPRSIHNACRCLAIRISHWRGKIAATSASAPPIRSAVSRIILGPKIGEQVSLAFLQAFGNRACRPRRHRGSRAGRPT